MSTTESFDLVPLVSTDPLDLDACVSHGPSASELFVIEAAWPLQAAELAVVAAECRFAASPDVLARRALRRAQRARDRLYGALSGGPVCDLVDPDSGGIIQ